MVVHLNELQPYVLDSGIGQVCVDKLLRLAVRASQAVLGVYAAADAEVTLKDDQTPLTLADRRAHALIVEGLALFPNVIGVISEEDDAAQRAALDQRRSWKYCWLVDPLDGTKEFIKRNGEFTVNIGLQKEGRAVGGVVVVPVTSECYVGFEGLGAWKCKLADPEAPPPVVERLACKRFSWHEPGLLLTGSRSHGVSLTDRVLDTLAPGYQMRACGSSLKMLAVAEGAAHLYPRFGPCSEWDTCAAHAILKEAGGNIYRVDSATFEVGRELEYNKEDLLNPFFLCIGDCADAPKMF